MAGKETRIKVRSPWFNLTLDLSRRAKSRKSKQGTAGLRSLVSRLLGINTRKADSRKDPWWKLLFRFLPKVRFPIAWILAGWSVAFVSVLALLNFHPVLKTEMTVVISGWIIAPLFLAGLTLMIRGYSGLPKGNSKDWGQAPALACLVLLMAAGAFLRLYHLGIPPGPFWDDWATTLVWVHNVVDRNKFYWMFPSDGIEPFNPYVISALQALLPDEVKDIVVRRLASCLVDMGALGILYLAGKELGSRRIGLFAVALGALGRPMLQLTITGMRAYTLSLAVGLLILACLRLFRKPTLGHFLLFGFALAFGVHTYSSFRVFALLLPFFLLPWVVREPEKKFPPPISWLAGAGAVFLLFGVYSGTLCVTDPHFSAWNSRWEQWVSHPWTLVGIFALGLAPAALSLWASRSSFSRLTGWSCAVGLSALLVFPLTLSNEFNGRMAVLSPFQNPKTSGNILGFLADQVWQTLLSLFYFCKDRNDLTIATDPFFDLFSQGALLLGLAFFIARPGWRKAFLLLVASLGVAVYVISFDPASTKLIAAAPPMYLLAAVALDAVWLGLERTSRKGWARLGPVLLGIGLAAYAVWGGWIQFNKVWGYWAQIPMVDTVLAKNVAQDEPLYRVYLAPSDWFFGWNAQFVLEEGRRYYILKEHNAIPLRPGEVARDLVIYVYGSNATMIKTLHEQFPSAWWDKIFVFPHRNDDPNPELYMWRVRIRGADIPVAPSFVIYKERADGPWLRRYYNSLYGWGLSGILDERKVGQFSDPIDEHWLESTVFQKYSYARLGQFLGEFIADRTSDYEWSIRFSGPIWIQIDGQTVWKRDVASDGKKSSFRVHLDQGVHQLEIRARFPFTYQLPEIGWREAGDRAENPL